jgi:hypothetical protein
MIWWHRCSTHGKREGKATGGRVAAAHVGWLLCVLCVACCVLCLWLCFVFCNIYSILVVKQYQPSQNGPLLRTHITKSAPKDNKY